MIRKRLLMAVSGAALMLSGAAWAQSSTDESQSQDLTTGTVESTMPSSSDTSTTAVESEPTAADPATTAGTSEPTAADPATTAGTSEPVADPTKDPAASGTAATAGDEGALEGAVRYGSYSGDTDNFSGAIAGGYSAEDLIGKNVVGSDGDTVGEIHDLLISETNTVEKVLVDVGGFLGMGERRVALNIDELELSADGEFSADMTKEQLEALPEYEQVDNFWSEPLE